MISIPEFWSKFSPFKLAIALLAYKRAHPPPLK
jgi:hypothetical protein